MSSDPIPNPFAPRPATQRAATSSAPIEVEAPLTSLFGSTLLSKTLGSIPTELVVVDRIGIYFSAHWCPPCRMFTPQLTGVYQQARQLDKSFEIVFATRDHDANQFSSYFNSMGDWLAIPFGSDAIKKLMWRYQLTSIPSLVIIDGATGQLITANGRGSVMSPSFLSSLPSNLQPATPSIDDVLTELSTAHDLSREARAEGIKTVMSILSNLIDHPTDFKYRMLRKANKSVQAKLMVNPAFSRILQIVKFKETPDIFCCYRPDFTVLQDTRDLLRCVLESYADDDESSESAMPTSSA